MFAAPLMWAADHEPDTEEGAAGYVLRAQEAHDIRALRRRLEEVTSESK